MCLPIIIRSPNAEDCRCQLQPKCSFYQIFVIILNSYDITAQQPRMLSSGILPFLFQVFIFFVFSSYFRPTNFYLLPLLLSSDLSPFSSFFFFCCFCSKSIHSVLFFISGILLLNDLLFYQVSEHVERVNQFLCANLFIYF